MLSVAICDDEDHVVKSISNAVTEWSELQKIHVEVLTFSSGADLLKEWNGRHFDLILLDIDMPGITGFDVAKQIREIDSQTILVFLTGLKSYVFSGYEVGAFRYLLKPVSGLVLQKVLSDSYKSIQARQVQHIVINNDGSVMKINIPDIIYIESFGHHVEIVTKIARIQYNHPIVQMERHMSPLGFFRCHRSFLVNLVQVDLVENNWLVLTNGKNIPVSRVKIKELKTALLHQL